MPFSREKITEIFNNYTAAYDASDEKIRLKIEHTFRVADITDQITKNLGLGKTDADMAWAIGMLHDIGRFEQIRRYQTFYDAKSVDHAEFGADLLFKENLAGDFFPEGLSGEDLQIIELAIRQHNKYRICEGLTNRQMMFANIIRDADKVDILRVNVQTPMEVIYDVTMEDLKSSAITPEVMQCFDEGRCVLKDVRKTAIDNLVGHIALAFELVYPVSRQIADRQGFIYQMLAFASDNPSTQEKFVYMQKRMRGWLTTT